MNPTRRVLTVLGLGLVGTALAAAAPLASGIAPTSVKPVIGQPVTVPAQPLVGKRFTVSLDVTRRDTGAPLTRGTMICDPSVGGRMIRHVESFKRGTARLAFVVPAGTAGRLLKVKVTITAGQSATKVASFRIQAVPVPSLSIGNVSVAEGSAGTTTVSLPVTLSAAATRIVSVDYTSADGTATAASDYVAASGTLTFQPGETAKTIAISVVADMTIEPTETFTVALSNPVNATIANGGATGTITNDDTAVPVTPGAYKGATRSGNYVFFSVVPDRTVTGFRVNDLPQRCGGVRTSGGEDLSENVYRIRNGGRFSGETTWTGSIVQGDVEWTRRDTKLTGIFNTPTSATGTITVTGELNYKGQHYRCTSGNVTWSATIQN